MDSSVKDQTQKLVEKRLTRIRPAANKSRFMEWNWSETQERCEHGVDIVRSGPAIAIMKSSKENANKKLLLPKNERMLLFEHTWRDPNTLDLFQTLNWRVMAKTLKVLSAWTKIVVILKTRRKRQQTALNGLLLSARSSPLRFTLKLSVWTSYNRDF